MKIIFLATNRKLFFYEKMQSEFHEIFTRKKNQTIVKVHNYLIDTVFSSSCFDSLALSV